MFIQPSLTRRENFCYDEDPDVETPGYNQLSLRDRFMTRFNQ
jgi:hypothetical protein